MKRRDLLFGRSGDAEALDQFQNSVLPKVETTTGLEPYAGPWGSDQAAHLLRRTMFGAKSADITMVAAGTLSQALDLLLTDQPAPADPLVYSGGTTDPAGSGKPWIGQAYVASADASRLDSLGAWWIDQMLNQKISLTEKMVLFWHNHLVSGSAAVNDARYMYVQNKLLRANALGNFKSLVNLITVDPAMLRYLNGNSNTKASPNENYGRELQELFTIGKGPEIVTGNYTWYTEADVKAAAHVLTGWSEDPVNLTAIFSPGNHDTSDKTFSAAYGNTVIKGRADKAGALQEISDLLTMIFNQDETAKYLARKLYRWFVDYVIDATIEQKVIVPLAQIIKDNNYEMKPALRALFMSAHFFDQEHVGSMIKNPLDFIIGSFRVLGAAIPQMPTNTVTQHYYGRITLRRLSGNMAMMPLLPPNVAGWPAYWQDPVFYELWINTDTLQKRVKMLDDLMAGIFIYNENPTRGSIDVLAFAKLVSNPGDVNVLIAEWSALLFPTPLTVNQVATLKTTLLAGLPDYEWTVEWSAYTTTPTAQNTQTVTTKLTALLKYMLDLAEYQLM